MSCRQTALCREEFFAFTCLINQAPCTMEEKDYLEKWIAGTLTDSEWEAFKQTDTYRFVTRLDHSLQQFRPASYAPAEEEKRLKLSGKAKVVPFPRRQWLKIAASVAIVLAATAAYFFYQGPRQIEVAATKKTDHLLPDASLVSLNAHSAIRYHDDWAEKRKVWLQGEAFFRVAKGSRFDVETALGTVTVTGTAFNVKQRSQYFEVICFEGSVQVVAGPTTVSLTPLQGWRTVNGAAAATSAGTSTSPDWLNNESRFQSVPLVMVLEEFERQYNVKIATDGIDVSRIFTGSFTHTDMELALKSITIPLNLTFKLEDDLVRLSGKR